jgi:hypothetical protein
MFAWKGEGVSASAFTTRIAFSKVILSRKRYEVMESKGSLGVNFSDTNHFPEFWWIFYWRANKAWDTLLLGEMKDEEDENR